MARPSAAQRKEMILQATLELFRQKGIASSSTRDVAERTGLARSHIYHYFKDWKTLCLEAVESFSQQDLSEWQARVTPLPPHEALADYIRDYLPDRQDAAWCIYLDAWREAQHYEVFAARYQHIITAWRQLLQQILQRGIDSGAFRAGDASLLARQLTALLNGYADELILQPDASQKAAVYQDIMQLVQQLILPIAGSAAGH
ncbi:TetR/AcrR family transcriptional regulator [Serratia marcescens]|uniref:TetR/AcrR family transcriptional regulator n=1 Tax=Serratia marcescens TaxID=615 RepID=UPI002FD97B49